ncbi:hypothetical protein EYR36_001551 [Pleurotus pulmonarius]|nr:hypothetical protein EYR36_001551 [Pleurotus pulmonarius]
MATRTPPPRNRVVKKPLLQEVKRDMAREMKGNWIGPCPLEHFFESMNAPPEDDSSLGQPNTPATYFKDQRVTCEKDLYKSLPPLINGNSGYPSLLPNHTLVDTFNHADPNSEKGAGIRPDLSHYEHGLVLEEHPTTLDLVILAYEVKKARKEDIVNDTMKCTKPLPHNDCQAPYEKTSQTSTITRGQLANYATQICRRQHRTHFYMVFIFHPFIRFIRWDRAGAIVTKRINYVEDCTPFVRFLYLFGRLDRAGKGFDPTVRPASQFEAEEAKKYLKRWEPKLERTVFKMDVPAPKSKMRQFLVWGSLADPESPLGRATRGYPAVEVIDGVVSTKPVFLKEQWRSVAVRPEVETLKELNEKGVLHVPTLLCGGDLPGQETKTHEISIGNWRVGHKRIDKRIHTRFVVAEVGQPLENFPSSRVMLGAIYNAFQGHEQAYGKCKIWHRDISGGNILILDNNEGLLSDWDLARKEADLNNGARAHERTGTWPFMSVGLLQQPNKRHTTRDDLESFFWVILYYGLHYLPHTHRDSLAHMMKEVFDQYDFAERDGMARGGNNKDALVRRGRYLGSRRSQQFSFTGCQPLTEFLFDCLDLLGKWDLRYDPTIQGWEEDGYIPASHAEMEPLWRQALQSPLWPVADRAVDQVRLSKRLDFIVRGERPERKGSKRSDPRDSIQDDEDDDDDDECSPRKRRKTCHGSEAAHL